MILYRALKDNEVGSDIREFQFSLDNSNYRNNFEYDSVEMYKHFFIFYDSAKYFLDLENMNRIYDRYNNIAIYQIDDDIIKDNMGIGEYPTNNKILFNLDNFISHDMMIFPEVAIPGNKLNKCKLIAICNSKYINYYDIDNCIKLNFELRDNHEKFLNYLDEEHEYFHVR